jgi:hypothetical protein
MEKSPPPVIPVQSSLPRYYSNKDDAQLAQTLKTMKIQAITARPVVDDFKLDETSGEASRAEQSGQPGYEVLPAADSAAMAALTSQQDVVFPFPYF